MRSGGCGGRVGSARSAEASQVDPHDLVASFRSTLDEARDARLLLHVVDGSDPAFREQHAVTEQVLSELAAGQNPRILVLNKADRLEPETRAALEAEFPEAIVLSARDPHDVARLHARIVDFFERTFEETEMVVPYAQAGVVHELHENGRVTRQEYQGDTVTVEVEVPVRAKGAIERMLAG